MSFTFRIFIVILAIAGSLWLFTPTLLPSFSENPPSESPHTYPPIHQPKNTTQKEDTDSLLQKAPNEVPLNHRVVIRTVATNSAGMGSVVAQLRSSAAIATMLDATFSTFGVVSSHISQYQAASLLHLDRLETPLHASSKLCSISASPHHARTLELVESWCDNMRSTDPDTAAMELREMYKDCDVILDDRPWDVRYDMSKCTWEWVKHVFTGLGLKKRESGIGLHIRWGDMSVSTPWNDPLRPERSTPIDVASQLVRKMRECGIQDELSVYMEWHNATMLSGLGEPAAYRIVDTGDSINDLIDLASNRIMILDISSYTVLAHQIAHGGVTIVPDIDLFSINWHDNGVNSVLRWHELLSIPCDDFSALLEKSVASTT
jgi:hypothetical protein